MNERDRYARGLRQRRAVLGARTSTARCAPRPTSTGTFQDLLTRYVWGEIWTRPGLPRKTRRLLIVASWSRSAGATS